ncbi:hypothetical protein M378DRAFT_59934, partial [Amanita muscaria Koide BX008]
LPNFVGQFFPRRDDPAIYPFYCACMLILLKPWRDLRTDLKSPTLSWSESFKDFMKTAPERVKFALAGIQYFHDCDSSA